MEIDYRTLLKRYMRHVLDTEGVTFVDQVHGNGVSMAGDVEFTEKEMRCLRDIQDEVEKEVCDEQ